MEFPIPVSKWKICDCGKGDWQVVKIDVDDKIEERIRLFCRGKYRRMFLREIKEGKLSRKQYIFTIRCRGCNFTWTKFVSERMLQREEGLYPRLCK